MTKVYLLLIIGLGVFVYILIQALEKILARIETRCSSIEEKLEDLNTSIQRVEEKVEEIEINTMPPLEKDRLRFENLPAFSLEDVRSLKKGDTLNFIIESWEYPHEDPFIYDFEYKHGSLDESERTEYGYRVHGFQRWLPSEDWEPYEFWANEKECQTSDCGGTIKSKV